MFSGWPIFAVKLVITSITAAGLAYKISDYVVRANTASINETLQAMQSGVSNSNQALTSAIDTSFRGLQSSMEALTASIDGLARRFDGMSTVVLDVSSRSASMSTEVVYLRRDVDEIRVAVDRLASTTPAVFYTSTGAPGSLEGVDTAAIRALLESNGFSTESPIIFDISTAGEMMQNYRMLPPFQVPPME